MSVLLLDIGNSRIKPAWLVDGALQVAPAIVHAGDVEAALAQIIDDTPPDAVWISQVLGVDAETRLIAAVDTRWHKTPRFAHSLAEFAGLRSGYSEPHRLGVDRWLAMLGVRADASSRGVMVIDAGTALTADWVDAAGEHRGGFIAPGLLTAQRGVLGATRFATRDLSAGYTGDLGRDTEACVRQGAMLGCLGAIDRAVAIAGDEARRVITGGDAALLLPYLIGDWEHRPHLVLEGLASIATARD